MFVILLNVIKQKINLINHKSALYNNRVNIIMFIIIIEHLNALPAFSLLKYYHSLYTIILKIMKISLHHLKIFIYIVVNII